ncbi:hypothetical protein DOT37_02980 [Pantoea agglomerans]|nr:hypothetical protein [Pantoea agglomerans]RAH33216.1 hypothetical protein DOT37_02980 [Pantoea agglomerans]TGX94631.1 hypothetical protein E5821_02975 [Pantoea agglomerans]
MKKMRERPIIFNADMVRAVLDGRKTQTRRIVNGVPSSHDFHGWVLSSTSTKDEGKACWAIGKSPLLNKPIRVRCPFGEVGDRLWVRETWMPDAPRDGTWGDVEFYGCKGSPLSMIPKRYRKPEHCIHRASWEGIEMVGWTPSIHMPRWASRITLEITGVRVERLQDISEQDAAAEGASTELSLIGEKHYLGYRSLWKSIYGADSWQSNPWVWVIEFKRVEVE